MTRKRTEIEAAGKLISAIQKEWGEERELGDSMAEESEVVLGKAHDLLKAAKSNEQLRNLLGKKRVSDFLGHSWVEKHASVLPVIRLLEVAMSNECV
jgi:hypothetical protein